ncbi:Zyg eleven-related protein 1 [Trichinella zimbabwensis]|uniref:Zyg eleven-related protein 1 n=1 Tax=Trichinella zimbabwensis TaxID=268475 RepID=A0A0V1I1R6_9BILA|nr:Zyg eleven-related protein 1 [Trichinella zimbabwensis]KRZ16875.1 Zyg eleven-related protein 1 [Trichinella zimbabwensis]
MDLLLYPQKEAINKDLASIRPLRELCVQKLVDSLSSFVYPNEEGLLQLRDGICLPLGVSEMVLSALKRKMLLKKRRVTKSIVNIMSNAQATPMFCLDLSNSDVDNSMLLSMLSSRKNLLTTLRISNCIKLTEPLNPELVRSMRLENLQILDLSYTAQIFVDWILKNHGTNKLAEMFSDDDSILAEMNTNVLSPPSFASDVESSSGTEKSFVGTQPLPLLTEAMPNVKALIFHNDGKYGPPDYVVDDFIRQLLKPLPHLTYLDLSYWSQLGDLSCITDHCQLTTLILHGVGRIQHAVDTICKMKTLRYLDISQHNRSIGDFVSPVTTLDRIIRSLPELTGLDISGTNLASNPTQQDLPRCEIDEDEQAEPHEHIETDIFGLRHLKRKLKFLGLFYTHASHYRLIPAETIAGELTESQVFVTIEHNIGRPMQLLGALNEAYQLYRYGDPNKAKEGLEYMVWVMRRHMTNSSIQIAASACIFYILRLVKLPVAERQAVIDILLTGMEQHSEITMIRNCCLSLCQFEIPQDMHNSYIRAMRLLLNMMEKFDDFMTQRIVVHVLNTMACHVEGEQKLAVGELHAVEKLLALICTKLQLGICDEVMEVAWSFLWNITDETPANCERFLAVNGMEVFYACSEKFEGKTELARNMMGLLGNVAEVSSLRASLMNANYIAVFLNLLRYSNEGIEISYNSAGVLAHLLSDGPEKWSVEGTSQEYVSQEIIKVVRQWPLDSRRYINYRSFEPIIRLLRVSDNPAVHLWAVWALANLTTVNGRKYVDFVIREQALDLIKTIAYDPKSSAELKHYASVVLYNVKKHVDKSGQNADDNIN